MSAPLLLELLCEELPPRALRPLSESFARSVVATLEKAGLVQAPATGVKVFATPRRLGVLVPGVAAQGAPRPQRHRLVPVGVGIDAQGGISPALRKKLEALGLASHPQTGAPVTPADLEREADGKNEILYLRATSPGLALAEVVQEAIDRAIRELPIPKVMNYQLEDGTTTVQFVRPAHALVALHGSEVVPAGALGLRSGRESAGHRFHAPGALRIRDAAGYEEQLRDEGRVIASFDGRRQSIQEQLGRAAARLGARAIAPEELLEEVTALVEWPVVLESGFDAEFLAVPRPCLVLTMQQHQRYFALEDAAGALLHRFLLVSNLQAEDPSAIIAGNARVVRARLADARFFFDQDRQQKLETRLAPLAHVVYHNRLGSQLERVERVAALAARIAPALGVDTALAARAARLAKADLATAMVGEFPELQGTMGAIYARLEGEDPGIVAAIDEHLSPRSAADAPPASALGACVALADKLEALAGLFGAGERASGDRDPYALRRNALGVLRILSARPCALGLQELVGAAFAQFDQAGFVPFPEEVERFLFERLRGMLLEQGYSAHEVESVLALAPGHIDRVAPRLAAVRAFLQLPEAQSLAAANKRIANLLKKAPDLPLEGEPEDRLLREPAEIALAAAWRALRPKIEALHAAGDDTGLLLALAPLRGPVDAFFDKVLVLADDPALRANRLRLLARLRALMNRVAEVSLLAPA